MVKKIQIFAHLCTEKRGNAEDHVEEGEVVVLVEEENGDFLVALLRDVVIGKNLK